MGANTMPATPPAVDGRLEALANYYRRFLLYYLREHGSATRTELTDVLAGWLASVRGVDADRLAHEQTQIALQHVHLPKLLDCGLVEYDADTGVVSLGAYPSWVDECLDLTFRVEAQARGERPESLRDLIDG